MYIFMKHKAVTKRNQTVRGLYKTVATLVALLGMVYGLQAQTTGLVGQYPFPQNYSYPNGATYLASGTTAQIQLLYEAWKKSYYEEGTINGVKAARVKFVQADEPAGANTVSEGIAYGMLITLWMDNSTNKTKDMFDKLFAYYKANKDAESGVLMNWKVVGFTGSVTPPASGNSNSATDADLDVAATLILAAEQWKDDAKYYKTEATKLLTSIWAKEVAADFHLKPGDAFDDWLNPCYFITNELELFHDFEPTRGWDKVRDRSYTIMKKIADPTTGLMPDWVNTSDLSYCKPNPANPKFTSYFLYDAIRCPWRLAMAYSWYGHTDAKAMASKIVDWAILKYGNSPGQIVDGYFLNGDVFNGASVGLGAAYPTHGKNHNPCFSGGIGVGGMVDGTKYKAWIPSVWNSASSVDAYGMYYTNTTQLMYMMYMTGNMPNLRDMLPVYVSSVTNTTGTVVNVTFSKTLTSASATKTYAATDKTFYVTDGAGVEHLVTSSRLLTDGKTVELTLKSAVNKAPYTITYTGTTLTSTDGKVVAPFGPFDVTDEVTDGVPVPKSARTDANGSIVYLVMNKELDASSVMSDDFSITVNGSPVTVKSAELDANNLYQVNVAILNTPVASKLDVIKITYGGTNLASLAYAYADPFTYTVNNLYHTTTCVMIDDVNSNAGWKTSGVGAVAEMVNDPATTDANSVLHFKTGGNDIDVKTVSLASKKLRDAFNGGNSVLTYRMYPKTAVSKLRFRLFDTLTAMDWGDNQILDEQTVIAAADLNKWTEKSIDLSGFVGGAYPLSGMSIDMTPGTADAGEFYIDDIRLCAPVEVPHIITAYTSYDGKTIIARYNLPVAAPATVSGLTGKATTTFTDDDIIVDSIYEKSGDGTELIFRLKTPLTDATASLTLTYVKTGSIKDVNGVPTEAFSIAVTNSISKYVTTGWYDDFNDKDDYVTANLAKDIYSYVEDPAATTGAVAGKITIDGSGITAGDKYQPLVVAVSDQVWDLSKNPTVTLRYNYAGTAAVYAKVQLKDVTGKVADELSNFTLKTGWNEITLDFSGHFVQRYQGGGTFAVNSSAITQMQLFLMTSNTTGVAYRGTLDIDKLVIGKSIRVYNVATKASQGSTVAATANFDGALYLVPLSTSYTVDAFKAAVFDKKATTISCSADKVAAIPTTGLTAGSYMVVGYYSSTGALTSKADVTIVDVTAPKITSTVGAVYPYGSMLAVATDEAADVYLVPAGGTYADVDALVAAQCADKVRSDNTANITLLDARILEKLGSKFVLYAVDLSGNISVASASFDIKDVTPPTFSIGKTTFAQGVALAVTNIVDYSATTMYLIPSTKAIASVADLTTGAVAKLDITAKPAGVTTSAMFTAASMAATAVPVGTYYVYIADAWGNISAPSPLLQVVAKIIATTAVSIPATLTVDKATTISVSDPNASKPIAVTYTSATTDAPNDQVSVEWTSADPDYVVVFQGTTPGTAIIVGRTATTTPVNVTAIVRTGTIANPKVWATQTMAVTVNGGSTVVLPSKITITKDGVSASETTVNVALGTIATFAATVEPANAKDQTYSFTSRNAAIATVSATGVVSPVSVGSAYVVVTANGDPSIKDSVLINVPAIDVTSVTIATPASTEVTKGNVLSLTATVMPANATFQDITWTTSDASIATVSATPIVSDNTSTIKVSGVAAGKVTITATSTKYAIKSTMEITVVSDIKLPTAITSTTKSVDLKVGEVATAAPVLTFTPTDATNQNVTWTVVPSTLATVSATGIVTAGSTAGSGELVATSVAAPSVSLRIPLNITDYVPTSVVIAPTTGLSVKVGETKAVFTSVSVEPDKASQLVTYSITPTTVATIDATGKVTGVSKGKATITVTASGTTVSTTATIDVVPVLVSSITISKSTLPLIKGNETNLQVTEVLPAGATDKTVEWSSSAPTIVSVSATGHITALAVGAATITATAKDGSTISASCDVTVAPVASIVSLSTPTGFTLKTTDAAVTNTATITPDSAEVKTVVFTVDQTSEFVTISQTGNVVTITPKAVGTATIKATATGTTASAIFTVDVVSDIKDVESVTLTPATASLFLGDADTTFTAAILPVGAPKAVSWSSSDENVVTVVNGVVHIVGAGVATVTATSTANPLKSGSTSVTVAPRYVSDITLSVASIVFTAKDQTKTIIATISPDNATTKGVTFESSAPTVVSVDANGLVTALAEEGTATITVKSVDGKVSKTVDVTISKVKVSDITASSTADISVSVGGNATLPTVTVTMSDNSTSTSTWTSNDETVVKFVNGKLVAVAEGSTTIVATADADATKKVTITVFVTKVAVTAIELSAEAVTVAVDASKDITVSITPDNATYQTVTAKAANTNVSVSVSGKTVTVTGKTASTTPVNVDITVDGVTKPCAVTVSANVVAVTSVEFDLPTVSIQRNITDKKLSWTVLPTDATDQSVTFTSSDETIVKVAADGTLIPVKAGSATITVKAGNKEGTCTVEIKPIAVISISTKENTVSVAPNGKVDVSKLLLVNPTDADNVVPSYTITPTSIATIDAATGIVTGVAVGSAIVTITVGNKSTEVTVNVSSDVVDVTSVTTTDELTQTVDVGKTITLSASVLPASATVKTISWSTDVDGVVTLTDNKDGSCSIAGVAGGVVKVYAESNNNKKVVFTITVVAKVVSISLGESKDIIKGDFIDITAAIGPNTAKQVVEFSKTGSGLELDVTGDKTARITASGAVGSSITVVATATDGSDVKSPAVTYTIIDIVVLLESLSASVDPTSVEAGETAQIAVTYTPAATTQTGVTYSSSNPDFTVSADGLVTALHGGEATITITSTKNATIKTSVKVSATEKVTGFELSLSTSSVGLGASSELVVTAQPTTATTKTVTAVSADPTIATVVVDPKTGKVTVNGVKVGKTTITVTATDGSDVSKTIEVEVAKIPVSEVKAAATVKVNVGSTASISASVAPLDATVKTLTYSSADEKIATVSATGLVKGVAAGTVSITVASVDDPSKTATVKVIVYLNLPNVELLRAVQDSANTVFNNLKNKDKVLEAVYTREASIALFMVNAVDLYPNSNIDSITQAKVDRQVELVRWAINQLSEGKTLPKPTDAGLNTAVEFNVWPNPTADVVSVTVDELVSVQVVDINGKVVAESSQNSVSLANIAPGSYTIIVKTINGVATQSVIKQ